MSENTKGTEPRVLSTFIGDDLRDRQIAEMPGGVTTRSMMKGGLWSPWVGADAEGREIARLAASNRVLVAAVNAILRDPHGCRFCDSGKLRNPAKQHDDTCGYLLANAALAATPRPPQAINERLRESASQAFEVLEALRLSECDDAGTALAPNTKHHIRRVCALLWTDLAALSPDPAPSAETSEAQP